MAKSVHHEGAKGDGATKKSTMTHNGATRPPAVTKMSVGPMAPIKK